MQENGNEMKEKELELKINGTRERRFYGWRREKEEVGEQLEVILANGN